MRQESINKIQSWALAWYVVQEKINTAKENQARYEVMVKDFLLMINPNLYNQIYPPTDVDFQLGEPLKPEDLEDADRFLKELQERKTITGDEIINAYEARIGPGLAWRDTKQKKK